MLTGATADRPMMGFAGKLELPAMGLGGWIYNGMDRLAVLGDSGDPAVSGLGFHAALDERWPVPNPTGRSGVVPDHCPHFPNMHVGVAAYVDEQLVRRSVRRIYARTLAGERAGVRRRLAIHEESVASVAAMAQQVYARFGKFPDTVPGMQLTINLQPITSIGSSTPSLCAGSLPINSCKAPGAAASAWLITSLRFCTGKEDDVDRGAGSRTGCRDVNSV